MWDVVTESADSIPFRAGGLPDSAKMFVDAVLPVHRAGPYTLLGFD
jgi:hypothetical protein